MARVLIIGMDGAIGQALTDVLAARGDEVIGTTRRPLAGDDSIRRIALDLADPDVAHMPLPPCDVAVICAAMARFADCREKPALARAVNVDAAAALGRRIADSGGHVVLLSTSAVLACDAPHAPADETPAPRSAYGRLKAQAEAAILGLGDKASVLRLTKVITPDTSLLRGWVETLRRGGPIRAFSDHSLSPIAMGDVTAMLMEVIDEAGGGIYQVSGARDISYAEAAGHIAARLGQPQTLVNAVSAADNGIDANEITRFTSLDTSRLTTLTGWQPPEPETVLDDVLGLRD